MGYVVLARKYRPIRFEDVVGQDHVTTTLRNAIDSRREGHAYLFIGPRGIGKTTTARIMARAFNCERGPTANPCGECSACLQIADGTCLDIIEIDAASHTGVDNVRELREHARFSPTQCRFKIYIIDEVHMLSAGAFNALLKILEEPPPHVRFILATTEARKIPATIVSRCQRFEFRLVSESRLVDHIESICKSEGFEFEQEALYAIARAATGSVRDALSLTDQIAACGEGTISLDTLNELLGLADWESLNKLCGAIADRDTTACLQLVAEMDDVGKDMVLLVQDLLGYCRHLLVARVADKPDRLIPTSEDERRRIIEVANRFSVGEVTTLVEECAALAASVHRRLSPRVALETFLIRACRETLDTSLSKVIERMADLERRLAGIPSAPTGPRSVQPPRPAQSGAKADAPPEQPRAKEPSPETANENENSPPDDIPAAEFTGVSQEVADEWGSIFAAVQDLNNYTLASMLSHVTPVGVEGDQYVVEVGPAGAFFRKSLAKREYKRIVEGKIAELLGRTFNFVCRINESLAVEPAPVSQAAARVPADPPPVPPPAPPSTKPKKRGAGRKRKNKPAAPRVSADDREKVSSDENVRRLIDLFDGSLTTVRKLDLEGET